jgi:hypothetical protein
MLSAGNKNALLKFHCSSLFIFAKAENRKSPFSADKGATAARRILRSTTLSAELNKIRRYNGILNNICYDKRGRVYNTVLCV